MTNPVSLDSSSSNAIHCISQSKSVKGFYSVIEQFEHFLSNADNVRTFSSNTNSVKEALVAAFSDCLSQNSITYPQVDEIMLRVADAYVVGARGQCTHWLKNYFLRMLAEAADNCSYGYIDNTEHLGEYLNYAIDHLEHFGNLPLDYAAFPVDDEEPEEYGTCACWEAAGRLGLLIGDETPDEQQIIKLINTQAIT